MIDKSTFIIGFSFAFGLSLIMLYWRRKTWLSETIKTWLIILLSVCSIFGFVLSDSNNYRYLFYSMLVPAIYFIFDKLFKGISLKFQERDFYLYLSYSDDVDNHDREISPLDMLFSFTLLGLILGMTVFGAVLFGKDDLFNKWFIK